MYIDGDVLELDIEMDLEDVKALEQFVKERLRYIEEIVLLNAKENPPSTSALFTLLFWIKRQKPSIKIEAIDTMQFQLASYGTMYWVKA